MPPVDFGFPLSPAPSPVPSVRSACPRHAPSPSMNSHQEDVVVSLFGQLDKEAQERVMKRLVAVSPREVLVIAQDEIAPRLRRDPFRVFPVEISLRVLSYITDPQSLASAAQVSRLWYLMLSDDSTWRQLCAAHHFRRLSAAGSYVHPWTNDMDHERQPSQAIEDSPEAEPLQRTRSSSLTATEDPQRESLVAYTQAGTTAGTIQGPLPSTNRFDDNSSTLNGFAATGADSHALHNCPQPAAHHMGLPPPSFIRRSGLGIANGHAPNSGAHIHPSAAESWTQNWASLLSNGDSNRDESDTNNENYINDEANDEAIDSMNDNTTDNNATGDTTNNATDSTTDNGNGNGNGNMVRGAAPPPEPHPGPNYNRRLTSRASFGAMSGPASALTGFSRFRWRENGQREADNEQARLILEQSPDDEEDNNEDASVAAYYDPAACVSSPAATYRAHFAQQYTLTNAWIHGGRLAARYRLPNQASVIVTSVLMKDGYIVLALDTSRILVFSDDGKLLRSLYGHVMGVWALALSGSTLVSGGCDRDVREWDLATGACRKILRGHSSTVRCLAMAGPHIALSGGRDSIVRIWDLKNGKTLHRLTGHSGSVRRLEVIEKDGRQLAVSASYDGTARVWDIESGQCLHILQGHLNQIYSLAVAGNRIATGSLDHTIRIWDLTTGACLATLEGHSALVGQLQLRGSTLVSGGSDGAVRVWDLDQKVCVHRIAAHDNTVTSLQFNDERIVTGGPDCRVQIWNTRTGEHVRQLHKPGVTTVWGVAFQDDRLLTVYSEGAAIVVELVSFVPV